MIFYLLYLVINMCGIVGCVLKKDNVAPILLDSISKLEYRGYDSIGLATACDGKINLKKMQVKSKRLILN